MARPSTVIVVFMVSMNAFAGIMMAQGIDSMLGLDTTVGEDSEFDQAADDADTVNTGSSLGDTLFGMYNTLANGVGAIYDVIYPGLRMMERAGVPGYLTGLLGNLFTFIIFFDVASYVRGWGL